MKAKKIAVFDASETDLAVTAAALRAYYERLGERAVIREFSNPGVFICDFRDRHYDMAFLAVDSMRDVETARDAGRLDEYCPLFFVSRTGDYGLEGHRLNILDYLLKPVSAGRLGESVSRIGSRYAAGRNRANVV